MKSIKLDTTKKFKHYGEKVKQVGFHPSKPLVLLAHYNGEVTVFNYATQALAKRIEVSSKPLRSAIWAGEDWVVTAGDDLRVRVFNFHTTQRLFEFEGHKDFIRRVVFQPAQQFFLTCSDDKTVLRWGISGDKVVQLGAYEEHKHFVMDVRLQGPADDVFATASLDGTVKLWTAAAKNSTATLKGHKAGVNCVEFSRGTRPVLASGGDDFAVLVWDLATRTVLARLERHDGNVVDLAFLPGLPLLASVAEDGRLNFHSTRNWDFAFDQNNFMQKGWALAARDNLVAVGYDEGALVLQVGRAQSLASCGKGKLVWSRNNEVFAANLKALVTKTLRNFDRVDAESRELGSLEVFPHRLAHNDSAQFFAVVDDSEFLLYKTQTFKQVLYGKCKDFAWGPGGRFATLDPHNDVALQSVAGAALATLKFDFYVEALHGGTFLGVSGGDFLLFYDWDGATALGRIDVEATGVLWDANTLVVRAAKSFFVLRAHPSRSDDAAFELLHEIPEPFAAGLFVAGLFFYVSEGFRLNVVVAGRSFAVANIGFAAQPLEYLDNHERLFFFDASCQLSTFRLSQALLRLLSALDAAAGTAPADPDFAARGGTLSDDENAVLVKVLQGLDLLDLAFHSARNLAVKVDLGIRQKRLDECLGLCQLAAEPLAWKKLGDLALTEGRFDIADTAFWACEDLNSLLLLGVSTGDQSAVARVADSARARRNFAVAFAALHHLGKADGCLDVLLESGRFGEALVFARSFTPSRVPAVFAAWGTSAAAANNPLLAKKIARFAVSEDDNAVAAALEKLLLEASLAVPRSQSPAFARALRSLDLHELYRTQGKEAVERALADLASRHAPPNPDPVPTADNPDDGWEEAEIVDL